MVYFARPGPVCALRDRELGSQSGFPPGPWGWGEDQPASIFAPVLLRPLANNASASASSPPMAVSASPAAANGASDAMCNTMSNEELVAQILKLRDDAV
ncbi:MAG: hypothetical protein LBE78_09215 [Burkholderiaceae bacterium]|jgi:hypothetical protein|nr:hypothetical protein [Burkholderiaceae bacterium]